jgi:recombination protein RecT
VTDSLTTALEVASEPAVRKPFRETVERMRPELVKSLRDDAAVDILTRHYMTAIRLNPTLMECSQDSLLAALLLSAQVRMEPGPLGHVYLVPYKRECVWTLGYTGILELARRSERVGALAARVVWDNDEYVRPWVDEKGEHFALRPGPEDERGDRVGVLVTWKERAGSSWVARALDVPPSRVERARAASPAARKGAGPWTTDESAMWAKTGIRYARPWLPLSPDAGYAMQHDEAVLTGVEADADGAAQPVIEAAPSLPTTDDAATEHSVKVPDE